MVLYKSMDYSFGRSYRSSSSCRRAFLDHTDFVWPSIRLGSYLSVLKRFSRAPSELAALGPWSGRRVLGESSL